MLYSKLHKETIIRSRMYIDSNTVFILLPDTNVDVIDAAYNTNIINTNCGGILVPNRRIMIGKKVFDGKEHYYTLKKEFYKRSKDLPGKKLKVLTTFQLLKKAGDNSTKKEEKETFYFYDGSLHVQAMDFLVTRFGKIQGYVRFLEEISKLYRNIKNINPKLKVELLFAVKNSQGILYEFFKELPLMSKRKEFQELKFLDNFGFASESHNLILPILYKEKDKVNVYKPNLNKLLTALEDNVVKEEVEKEKIATNEEELSIKDKPGDDKLLKKLSLSLASEKVKIVDNDGELDIDVDTAKLKKAVRKYKINNPDIVNNIKFIIKRYIKEKKSTLSKDNLDLQILKAIHYTVFGTDKIQDKYLHNPQLLFEKIEKATVFIKPLKFPEVDFPIPPHDVVEIDYTTGQFRQKVEFEKMIHENVRRLFKVLEMDTKYPVKVEKITYDVVDDGGNRYYDYKVTLRNLGTGSKESYVVNLKVPALVNDKYFKIKGNTYILSSQLFLKPLTKTKKNEVRILTNFATITLKLKNVKFDFSDINGIVNYISVRYPNLIKDEINKNQQIKLNDGSIIHLTGEVIFESNEGEYKIDEYGKVVDPDGQSTGMGKYEFIVDLLQKKIREVNPKDEGFYKKNSYIELYLGGYTIPLIFYLWKEKGLLTTLTDNEIEYEISEESNKQAFLTVKLTGNKFLYIRPKTLKQKFLVNGLLTLNLNKLELNNPEDKEEINAILASKYGAKVVKQLELMSKFEIDPLTQELLEFEDLPKNLPDLLSNNATDLLFNKKIDSLADLRIYRARLSEIIMNLMYRQIAQAHNHYRYKVESGFTDSKIVFDSDYIMKNLINSSLLQECMPVNPVDEIMLSSKTTKLGKDIGGVPTIRAITPQHRNIHPTQYGNISINATPENTNVGVITHHTLTPTILNEYGSYGIKDINAINGTQLLALNEALVPFQHQMDSDRLVLATTHLGQVTPVDNREPPLLRTGVEHVVPLLASQRFVIRAEKDGVITKIEKNKTITIKYSDGKEKTYDIIPRRARTKRGVYVFLEMETKKEGDKVKANELIAWTKNFRDNIFCSGKNVFVAMMNYLGYCHEDGYAVSKDLVEETTTDIVVQQHIIVEPKMKILKLEKEIGKKVEPGDTLVEISTDVDIDEYLDLSGLALDPEDENADFLTGEKGVIKLEAKPGEIVDIKVFINNKVNLDKQIISLYDKKVEETKKIIKDLTKNVKDEIERIKAIDNLDVTFFDIGNHKFKGQEFKGALIIYYIKQKKKLADDKISNRYGAKGVISYIIPESPKGEFTEKVDVFISPIGVMSRKNVAMLKEIYIGKIMYFLNKRLKELAESKSATKEEIIKLTISVCSILMKESIVKDIEKYLNSFKSANKLKEKIKDPKFMIYCVVPPFEDITFEQINTAAKILGIPLDEKVYIPELKQWTKEKVPVGVGYYQFLEHYGYVYGSIRGSEKYSWLTGQPTKGKSKLGGQTIGNLDIYALLSTDSPNILKELLTFRSDDHQSKFLAYTSIIQTGKLEEIPENKGGTTSELVNTFIKALGIEATN